MKLIVLCASEESRLQAENNFEITKLEIDFLLESDLTSSTLNRLLEDELRFNLVCMVKESVTLPADFDQNIKKMTTELDREWPNWALVGESGVTHLAYGMGASKWVQYGADKNRGPNLAGHTVPAYGLSGNVLVINLGRFRNATVNFDGVKGPLGVTLPIQTMQCGLAVLVAPHLACFVDTSRIIDLESHFDPGPDLRSYLISRISNLFVHTCFGLIDISGESDAEWGNDRIDLPLQSLRNARVGRPKRSLEIITRTTFERISSLQRTALTVFLLRSQVSHLDLSHTVISGRFLQDDVGLPPGTEMVFETDGQGSKVEDDRFRLIRVAVESSKSDFVWFVDDDDWVFPPCAELLSLALNVSPKGSTFYFDSQQFFLKNEKVDSTFGTYPNMRVGDRYQAQAFVLNLTGLNHVPFCSVIFTRQGLVDTPDDLTKHMNLYEDFALQLMTMSSPNYFPVSLNNLVSGIQMKDDSLEGPVLSRREWNKDMATLVAFFVQKQSNASLLSLPEAGKSWYQKLFPNEVQQALVNSRLLEENQVSISRQANEIISMTQDLITIRNDLTAAIDAHNSTIQAQRDAQMVVYKMKESRSWRVTRPMRVLHRIFSRRKKDNE